MELYTSVFLFKAFIRAFLLLLLLSQPPRRLQTTDLPPTAGSGRREFLWSSPSPGRLWRRRTSAPSVSPRRPRRSRARGKKSRCECPVCVATPQSSRRGRGSRWRRCRRLTGSCGGRVPTPRCSESSGRRSFSRWGTGAPARVGLHRSSSFVSAT